MFKDIINLTMEKNMNTFSKMAEACKDVPAEDMRYTVALIKFLCEEIDALKARLHEKETADEVA